jgi:RNA polymerase sigma factor (sigma-70 family)
MRREELERLYEDHAGGLFALLVYRTGDRLLAEDLLSDTFVKAMNASRAFDRRKASAKTWLYSIALNVLRDHLRREGARSRALQRLETQSQTSAGSTDLERVGERELVSRALDALEPGERMLIALRYGADLTVPEVAALLGQPQTTVEGRLYRALGRLRRDLG